MRHSFIRNVANRWKLRLFLASVCSASVTVALALLYWQMRVTLPIDLAHADHYHDPQRQVNWIVDRRAGCVRYVFCAAMSSKAESDTLILSGRPHTPDSHYQSISTGFFSGPLVASGFGRTSSLPTFALKASLKESHNVIYQYYGYPWPWIGTRVNDTQLHGNKILQTSLSPAGDAIVFDTSNAIYSFCTVLSMSLVILIWIKLSLRVGKTATERMC